MRIARRINMNLKKQFGYPAKRGPFSAGFTLIELLVVVLIIGILSSVALPQYTKAVEKSRMTEAFTNLKIIEDQLSLYVLENGLPTTTAFLCFQDISSVELSGGEWTEDCDYVTKNFTYSFSFNNMNSFVDAQRNKENSYMLSSYYLQNGGWRRLCDVQRSEFGMQICKMLQSQGYDIRND